jgi:hypothetical protein
MARSMCMSGDGEPAAAIVSLLETADTFTLCSAHFQGFLTGTLAAMAGVDPQDLGVWLDQAASGEGTDGTPPDRKPASGPTWQLAEERPENMVDQLTDEIIMELMEAANGGDETAVAILERNGVITTAEGAPSDEPPPPAPADMDHAAE